MTTGPLTSLMLRQANVQRSNPAETIHKRMRHLLEEVGEVQEYVADGSDLSEIKYVDDGTGLLKPEGFAIEIADVMMDCLRLLNKTGHDPDEVLELKLKYHEERRVKKSARNFAKIKEWKIKNPKKGRKGK